MWEWRAGAHSEIRKLHVTEACHYLYQGLFVYMESCTATTNALESLKFQLFLSESESDMHSRCQVTGDL